jgi:hypothetical protein
MFKLHEWQVHPEGLFHQSPMSEPLTQNCNQSTPLTAAQFVSSMSHYVEHQVKLHGWQMYVRFCSLNHKPSNPQLGSPNRSFK